jgi:hypothetical protein
VIFPFVPFSSKRYPKDFFIKWALPPHGLSSTAQPLPLYAFDPGCRTGPRFGQNHKAAQARQVMLLHALNKKWQ